MNLNEVKEILNRPITKEEYIECYKAISEEINNHNTFGLIKPLILLKDQVINNELYSSRLDIIFINILFIRVHMYNNYAWRARMFVDECIELLDDVKFDKDQMLGAEIYKILGDASSCYLDCRCAYVCYAKSVSLYLETDYPIEYTAFITKLMIVSMMQLPDLIDQLPTDEEIIETFKDKSEDIIKAKNGKGYLLHDPVEQTKEFQEVYDDVMEEVAEKFKENPIHTPHYKWMLMTEAFNKRGIMWRNPQIMNPKVKFD